MMTGRNTVQLYSSRRTSVPLYALEYRMDLLDLSTVLYRYDTRYNAVPVPTPSHSVNDILLKIKGTRTSTIIVQYVVDRHYEI